MANSDGVNNEIALSCTGLDGLGVAMVDESSGTLLHAHIFLCIRGRNGNDLVSHSFSELDSNGSKTSNSNDSNSLSSVPGSPVDKRVPHGDSSAHDGGGLRVVKVGGDLEDKVFVDGVGSRVASEGLDVLVSTNVPKSLHVILGVDHGSFHAVLLIVRVAQLAVKA